MIYEQHSILERPRSGHFTSPAQRERSSGAAGRVRDSLHRHDAPSPDARSASASPRSRGARQKMPSQVREIPDHSNRSVF
jgi:hypothetical protein